jgi:hypothetical protein
MKLTLLKIWQMVSGDFCATSHSSMKQMLASSIVSLVQILSTSVLVAAGSDAAKDSTADAASIRMVLVDMLTRDLQK